MPKGLTYKQAGVNITQANKFVKDISRLVKATHSKDVLNNIGGFGGCFKLNKTAFKNPVLVSSADGVGTKIRIAVLSGMHDTLGVDLVAMNVNDILSMGARPLFFLDYISLGYLDRKKTADIVRGIARGCRLAGCALIGGETAEMPLIYKKGEYDLAGFCVGIADRNEIITGTKIKPCDILIGITSSGLHSNGFSIVNKLFSKREIIKRAKEFLTPTRIYVKGVLSVIERYDVAGIAHITGGAFYEKLMRIFPKNTKVNVQMQSWEIPDIFEEIKYRGKMSTKEMFRTFNMGIGMVLVVKAKDAEKIRSHLKRFKLKSYVIGKVEKSKGQSKLEFSQERG